MSKKAKTQLVSIDELLQTENEHYNEYAHKVVTECISKQIFADVETALKAYEENLNVIIGTKTPIEAVECVLSSLSSMQAAEYTDKQRHFILRCIADYINPYHTNFDKWELQQETHDILKSHIAKLGKELENNRPKTADIRESLKTLMQKEIAELPKRLETLDDEKRLVIICKLMPYVFPKVETVEATRGENKQWYED
ncbi:MAG: hypothetical protein LBT48_07380 [Prevotellaceae bacterium]|jgi:ribosome maturation protein Sdo1|nr:hypothetical protein [Prevotellaceae bacterium]